MPARPADEPRPAGTVTADPSDAGDAVAIAAPAPSRADACSVPAARMHDPERYQILGEHGRGGLGRVSRAHDLDLGRDIAIKELLEAGGMREIRFLREALITARLEHPGIVPVYEAGRWPDGTPFYAMKLVSGRSLRDLIGERPVEQRIGLLHHVIAVADAIAYAHGRNIIHRDLKPSNVIVGEFGETIVIDWGLAKDLSTVEDSGADGAYSSSSHDHLTSTGAILGTPAYMAPEQRRGENVDQRADVFALGAMLWELCAATRMPPDERGERRRALRRAGIDHDLGTIILKALDPNPERRYADAASLAADLKAFKAGARIAARSYSLFAMLGHWTRHHRALAMSVAAAAVIATVGSAFYIRNIAVARDRAETSGNRLLLEHAELLLRTDPTAARDLLATYRGSDDQRAAMLHAEADGRGASLLAIRPHTQATYFAHALPDGALVTFGADGAIAKTTPAGSTRILARDLTPGHAIEYSEALHLLGYACEPASICLMDVVREKLYPRLTDEHLQSPVKIALSPTGTLLAATGASGAMVVWKLSDDETPKPVYRGDFAAADLIAFLDEQTVALAARDHAQLVQLGASEHAPGRAVDIAISGVTHISTSPELHAIAVGTSAGRVSIFDVRGQAITVDRAVCTSVIDRVLLSGARSAVAYSCQDGDVGIWSFHGHEPERLGHVDGGANLITASSDGRYLLIGGNSGQLLIRDLTTKMTSSYAGHVSRITSLVAPSAVFPNIASGDSTGHVRIWPLPPSSVRVVIATPTAMALATPLPGGPIIAYGDGPTIPWYGGDGSSGELQGHHPFRFYFAASPTQARFATFGSGIDDVIELWSFEPAIANRTLPTRLGMISAAVFEPDGSHLIIGTRDGVVARWAVDDDTHHTIGSIHDPIAFMRAVPDSEHIVVAGSSGSLWMADRTTLRQLGSETGSLQGAVCSKDARWFAVGTSHNLVRLYDLASGEAVTAYTASSWIQHLAFSPDSAELAIATEDKVVVLALADLALQHPPQPPGERAIPWRELSLGARTLAFSPDNKWLAMTTSHGSIWFYARGEDRWTYLSTGTGRLTFSKFSNDSARFVTSDITGRALLVDMHGGAFH